MRSRMSLRALRRNVERAAQHLLARGGGWSESQRAVGMAGVGEAWRLLAFVSDHRKALLSPKPPRSIQRQTSSRPTTWYWVLLNVLLKEIIV